ncbi:hypothetical protein NLJ89_g9398 [Agrocybe chaxingu]|uniref:Hydrophobin n=1 Tax=Agrocybe chaxingu TaxID=84603 RepID=A0A9W8MT54_9AGAR|nr:hypothetical protein NLJ89_g9398 [Agrocybe chaxingu]
MISYQRTVAPNPEIDGDDRANDLIDPSILTSLRRLTTHLIFMLHQRPLLLAHSPERRDGHEELFDVPERELFCCGALAAPSTVTATDALSLVGVAVQDVTALVGLECSPITAIGVGSGASCSTSPVCCDKNFFNQGVGVNCSPVTVQA